MKLNPTKVKIYGQQNLNFELFSNINLTHEERAEIEAKIVLFLVVWAMSD